MGALCSKSGMLEGGHKVIATTRALGGEGAGERDSIPANPRQAALDAAERRRKEVGSSLVWRRRSPAGLKLYAGTTEGDERCESKRRPAFWEACGKEREQGPRTPTTRQTRGERMSGASLSPQRAAS